MKILEPRNALAKIKTVINGLTAEIDTKRWLVKLKVRRKYSDQSRRDKKMENTGGGNVKDIWYSRIMFAVPEEMKENSLEVILRK